MKRLYTLHLRVALFLCKLSSPCVTLQQLTKHAAVQVLVSGQPQSLLDLLKGPLVKCHLGIVRFGHQLCVQTVQQQ